MGVSRILLINDWESKKFLEFVLLVQLALWVMMGASTIGFAVPIFRQVIGFVCLAFIPGIALLRILRLHNLDVVETLLYSVGLSIAFVMFLSLFLNILHPFVLSAPISTMTLMIATTIATIVLCIFSYARDRGYPTPRFIEVKGELSLPFLILIAIPFLSVLSTQLMNFYDNNILQVFIFFLVSLVPVFIAFDKIPQKLYALAIFSIAISLFYQSSLISQYLWGWDIHVEYYFANLVKTNTYWNLQCPNNYNAMLSVVMLGPALSQICELSLTWVFKIIYPLLYSLVPLGLYEVLQKQVSKKISSLSCFFFIALLFTSSSIEMLQLARQEIAEVFLVLLILLMVDKRITSGKLSLLCIVFSFSLVVSHYGLSYIYMFLLVAALLISVSMKRRSGARNHIILPAFVLMFCTFLISWYTYTASGYPFSTIVDLGRRIGNTILNEFLNPKSAEGLRLLIEVYSPLLQATRLLNVIFEFFIFIGVFAVLRKYDKWNLNEEYKVLSYIGLALLLGGIAVPYFASSINTSRLYHIMLFFLAPFCIIGGIGLFNKLQKIVRTNSNSLSSLSPERSLKVLSVLLAVLFLFNSRFLFAVVGDTSSSSSMSLNSKLDFPRFNSEEVLSAKWLTDMSHNSLLYGDIYGSRLLSEFAFWNVSIFWGETNKLPQDTYVFLRSLNTEGKIIQSDTLGYNYNYTELTSSTFFNKVILERNRIYDNGGAAIYR